MPLRKAWVLGVAVLCAAAAACLLPLPWDLTTQVHNEVVIARSAQHVFDYVTTPAHWPDWHPSSLAVSGATGHPLQPGEQVSETFRVAGRSGVVVWTVTARQRPAFWAVAGTIEGRPAGTVAYTLREEGDQTRFSRDFRYRSPTLGFAILNQLVLRRRVEAESAEAVVRLKARLEGMGG
ncbi:polyketide cyclase [Cupriavidus sp. USMAA2-4]|uniref:SRPBCC family protein n=1 Tax=Cupriavidus sp. USMAA2-4 TaxID=876364 RepID=UPI0008A6B538|nr:SRPBCC family protein [Cupriavidus sp. USMAA2-4]AOY96701.1 polyketide cyclase [Cupriavidus sp. USMAA2-4]